MGVKGNGFCVCGWTSTLAASTNSVYCAKIQHMEAHKALLITHELKRLHPDAYRFLEKINPSSENDCWEWDAANCRKGYGRVKWMGRFEGAHRASYMLFVGEIPDEILVCHKCDNPKCVNPSHLFLGTYSDNMKDCFNKGRLKTPDTSRFKKGHTSTNSVLTNNQVKEIKALISERKLSLIEISRRLGVKYQTVRDINAGRSYINL